MNGGWDRDNPDYEMSKPRDNRARLVKKEHNSANRRGKKRRQAEHGKRNEDTDDMPNVKEKAEHSEQEIDTACGTHETPHKKSSIQIVTFIVEWN
jgi:hypothetical protein